MGRGDRHRSGEGWPPEAPGEGPRRPDDVRPQRSPGAEVGAVAAAEDGARNIDRRRRHRPGARRLRAESRAGARYLPRGCRVVASSRRDGDRAGALGSDRDRPAGVPRQDLDAASSAAAGEERGRAAYRHQVGIRAEGRPAAGDRGTGERYPRCGRKPAGAARRHRLGQDLHHGQGHRGDAAPGADPRAEQDARRAALRRVQVVLSGQRGGVFRLVLRLLPAGGLRAPDGYLHREGILHQRADRPHAPLGDAGAPGARRRHHRRLGFLHLRYRFGRDLHGDDLRAGGRRGARHAADHGRSDRAAVPALRHELHSRHVPGARRYAGAVSRPIWKTAHGASRSSATSSSRSTNSTR